MKPPPLRSVACGPLVRSQGLLAISGLVLPQRRQGGWRRGWRKAHGTGLQRWHVAAGQVLVGAVLELSSITALVMSAVTKGFINAEHEAEPGVVSTAPAHAPSGHFNSQIAFWP